MAQFAKIEKSAAASCKRYFISNYTNLTPLIFLFSFWSCSSLALHTYNVAFSHLIMVLISSSAFSLFFNH